MNVVALGEGAPLDKEDVHEGHTLGQMPSVTSEEGNMEKLVEKHNYPPIRGIAARKKLKKGARNGEKNDLSSLSLEKDPNHTDHVCTDEEGVNQSSGEASDARNASTCTGKKTRIKSARSKHPARESSNAEKINDGTENSDAEPLSLEERQRKDEEEYDAVRMRILGTDADENLASRVFTESALVRSTNRRGSPLTSRRTASGSNPSTSHSHHHHPTGSILSNEHSIASTLHGGSAMNNQDLNSGTSARGRFSSKSSAPIPGRGVAARGRGAGRGEVSEWERSEYSRGGGVPGNSAHTMCWSPVPSQPWGELTSQQLSFPPSFPPAELPPYPTLTMPRGNISSAYYPHPQHFSHHHHHHHHQHHHHYHHHLEGCIPPGALPNEPAGRMHLPGNARYGRGGYLGMTSSSVGNAFMSHSPYANGVDEAPSVSNVAAEPAVSASQGGGGSRYACDNASAPSSLVVPHEISSISSRRILSGPAYGMHHVKHHIYNTSSNGLNGSMMPRESMPHPLSPRGVPTPGGYSYGGLLPPSNQSQPIRMHPNRSTQCSSHIPTVQHSFPPAYHSSFPLSKYSSSRIGNDGSERMSMNQYPAPYGTEGSATLPAQQSPHIAYHLQSQHPTSQYAFHQQYYYQQHQTPHAHQVVNHSNNTQTPFTQATHTYPFPTSVACSGSNFAHSSTNARENVTSAPTATGYPTHNTYHTGSIHHMPYAAGHNLPASSAPPQPMTPTHLPNHASLTENAPVA